MAQIVVERDYDPGVVSNKLAVGECIEWIADEWTGKGNVRHVRMQKGILHEVRSRVLIIIEESTDGTHLYWRIERFYLEEWILDPELKEAVGTHVPDEPKTPKRTRKQKNQLELHDVYAHLDPRDKSIRYIGISTDPERRLKQHLRRKTTNFKMKLWLQELEQLGLEPTLTILERDIQGVQKARERETYWIQFYRRQHAPLLNFANMQMKWEEIQQYRDVYQP